MPHVLSLEVLLSAFMKYTCNMDGMDEVQGSTDPQNLC